MDYELEVTNVCASTINKGHMVFNGWSNIYNKGNLEINIKELIPYLKMLKKLKYDKVTVSIYNFNLYFEIENLNRFRMIIPLINTYNVENYNNETMKFNFLYLLDELKIYKNKDLGEIKLYFSTEQPIHFDINEKHKILIAPCVDN